MEEKDEKGFTIRDRRTVSSESTRQPGEETTQQPESVRQKPADTTEAEKGKGAAPLPELDFSSFILSLAATAQVSLGAAPDPTTGKPEQQNLPAAKQMIDILGIVKDKTTGNLSTEEQGLLDNILYSLRLQYVRTVEGKK
jgi:hypothetical protein